MKDHKNKIVTIGIVISIFSLLVALANFTYGFATDRKNKLEKRQEELKTDNERKLIQGPWLIKTTTNKTNITDYSNMELSYRAVLNIDDRLNIGGDAFKIQERVSSRIITFSRSSQSKAEITGSKTANEIYMRWKITDLKQRESLQTMTGMFVNNDCFAGDFYNDVAEQWGKFTAAKLNSEATYGNIDGYVEDKCK